MEMLTDAPDGQGPWAQGKQQQQQQPAESITGVKWIELQSNVKMVMHLDGNNSLLATGSNDQSKKPDAPGDKPCAEPHRAVTITTPGKFRYDVAKDPKDPKDRDTARFDAQTVQGGKTALTPPQVLVDRLHPAENKHHSKCRLAPAATDASAAPAEESQSRAPKDGPKPADGPGEGVDVETALATGDGGPGRDVTLTHHDVQTDSSSRTRQLFLHTNTLKQMTTIQGRRFRPRQGDVQERHERLRAHAGDPGTLGRRRRRTGRQAVPPCRSPPGRTRSRSRRRGRAGS